MRIAIVNDLRLACEALRRVVQSVPGQEVAWTASDGAEAVKHATTDRPDLILMDLIMPRVDGVEATRRIMAASPCPILVVTSSVSGNIAKVYDAMGYGALDAVDTPTLGAEGRIEGAEPLLRKIRQLGCLMGLASRAPAVGTRASVSSRPPGDAGAVEVCPLVLIGASTGGPKALAQVLAGLPADLPAAVVVAQHVDASFAPGLVRWLREHSRLPVDVVEPGVEPAPGRVLVAQTNDHVVIDPGRRLRYSPEPVHEPYRPSVDVLFQAAVAHWPRPGVGVVLTGMGRDGAAGLLALRRAGWLTLAQDQASSVVYGMPKAAAELKAAARVLAPTEIGRAIATHFHRKPAG